MFQKILIANRGEIAVRILRACHELGIPVVALYQASDRGSLHVRLADESVELRSPAGFLDTRELLEIAQERGVDAIHPGYGFLAERDDFIRACKASGIAFIGPPAEVIERVRHKIDVLSQAQQMGIPTPAHSDLFKDTCDLPALQAAAERLGYPLVVKSCRGGRGRGERLVWSAELLPRAVQRSQAEAQAVYGDECIYLERVILQAHQIGVQVAGDSHGNLVHLGEREGSLLYGNQKLVEEAPAPCLTSQQRQQIWEMALLLARHFGFQGIGTVEFLVDTVGNLFFTEFKPRIQIDHPLTEMLTRLDLVQEQIRVAAGQPLSFQQSEVQFSGWAMQCRIRAEDPHHQFLPSPGRLEHLRAPGGGDIRLETYLSSGCEVPAEYDPLIAKLVAWGRDRPACLARLRQALDEFRLGGVATNLPLLGRILEQPSFATGCYTTELLVETGRDEDGLDVRDLRALAVIAALVSISEKQQFRPQIPERLLSGWHRSTRRRE